LKVPAANFGAWNLRDDSKHRHAASMAIEQSIDEMKIPGPQTSRAWGDPTGQLRIASVMPFRESPTTP